MRFGSLHSLRVPRGQLPLPHDYQRHEDGGMPLSQPSQMHFERADVHSQQPRNLRIRSRFLTTDQRQRRSTLTDRDAEAIHQPF